MHIKTFAVAAASTALMLAPAAALAAQATTTLNVRSGPSTAYGVVDTLYPGEEVNVGRCTTDGWCEISHSGPDGWVSRAFLSGVGGAPSVGFSVETPGFSFSFGNPGVRRHPPRRRAEVCFYQRRNYEGPSFCARPGQADNRLAAPWNNRISSILIRGRADVVVCRMRNFRNCTVFTRSQPRLGRENNIISSYRVR